MRKLRTLLRERKGETLVEVLVSTVVFLLLLAALPVRSPLRIAPRSAQGRYATTRTSFSARCEAARPREKTARPSSSVR